MSTTLVTAAEVRELFAVVPEIGETRLQFCVEAAGRTLRGWVGQTAYADALLGEDATDKTRVAQLKAAESYLAIYHTLLNAGVRVRPHGVVKQEQDAAGPMGGTVLNQYLSPSELSNLRKQYFAEAEELAAPYRTQAGSNRAATFTLGGGWRRSAYDESDLSN